MNRHRGVLMPPFNTVPRERGDEPLAQVFPVEFYDRSPRARG